MPNELTDREAHALFNQISGALRNNDIEKLETLITPQEDEEDDKNDGVEVDTDDTEVEQPDQSDEKSDDEEDNKDDQGVDTSDKKEEEDKDPPDNKEPEDGSGNDEDDELAALRAQVEALKKDKEKADKEIHHFRSQAGRMKAMSRNMKKYDERLDELQRQISSPSNRPSAAILGKVKQNFKAIEDIDPELASLLENTLSEALDGAAVDTLTRERDTISLMREREVAEYEAQEAERLLEMYPNAGEVFVSPTWKAWKTEQSPGVVALAESSNADEVAMAFRLYAEAMVNKHPELRPATPPAPVVQEPNAAVLKAKEIEEERRRKKESSTNVRSPNAPGKVSLPDDPQALFDNYYEKIRKQLNS